MLDEKFPTAGSREVYKEEFYVVHTLTAIELITYPKLSVVLVYISNVLQILFNLVKFLLLVGGGIQSGSVPSLNSVNLKS